MIVTIPELDKQSHMISSDRNRDPDSNYGGKYKEEAKQKAWYGYSQYRYAGNINRKYLDSYLALFRLYVHVV